LIAAYLETPRDEDSESSGPSEDEKYERTPRGSDDDDTSGIDHRQRYTWGPQVNGRSAFDVNTVRPEEPNPKEEPASSSSDSSDEPEAPDPVRRLETAHREWWQGLPEDHDWIRRGFTEERKAKFDTAEDEWIRQNRTLIRDAYQTID
jgi:hypothetical protein